MLVCVFFSVYVCVRLFLSVCAFVSACVCLFLCVCVCICVRLFLCVCFSRAGIDDSKKWGMLFLINQLFKIYFKVRVLNADL